MSRQSVICVDNFRKSYEREFAVDGLSFNVDAGQILGLIGPNGAGKTTTLRAIAGIIPATAGTLCVSGHCVESEPVAVKQQTAYVPDDPQLFNDLTVEQHFAFTASVYEVENWQERMRDILDRFDLTAKLNARASELSRGMRQKLAIGCAYLYCPKALLLDEPMTGLDPRGIRVLKDTILDHAQSGAAIIISSHLLAMVEDICSDVMILDQGHIRYHGNLESLKNEFSVNPAARTLEDVFFQAVSSQ